MYHNHFGLKEVPFSIKVNPSYLLMTQQHKDALAHLLYGASAEGGFALLTGEVGTGKTTLIRALLQQLPDNIDIALVMNPTLNAVELLASICDELKIPYLNTEQRLKILTDKLQGYLLAQHAQGRGTVVLIDEAQHLSVDALEQIRLLTNLETIDNKLLQVILVGQPELDDKLNEPELRQLAQRITARFCLGPLSLDETAAYIHHRLHIAGLPSMPAAQALFKEPVIQRVYQQTGGVPRLINVLCDRILLGTYAKHRSTIDNDIVDLSIQEVFGLRAVKATGSKKWQQGSKAWNIFALLGFAAVLGGLAFRVYTPLPPPSVVKPEKAKPLAAETIKEDVSIQSLPSSPWWHFSYEEESAARNALLVYLSSLDGAESPLLASSSLCEPDSQANIDCYEAKLDVWSELVLLNRVAVLRIQTPSRLSAYIPVLGVEFDEANGNGLVMALLQGPKEASHVYGLPLSDIGELWTGETTLLWQAPPTYTKPIGRGAKGKIIPWLAERFALLDGREDRLAETYFTVALAERVKLFQSANGLDADGVVGFNTLVKLNDALMASSYIALRRVEESLPLFEPLLNKEGAE